MHKELPFFMHAFFHHQVLEDYTKAKKLYKEALKRTEYTRGCVNMLASIYLVEAQSNAATNATAATRLLAMGRNGVAEHHHSEMAYVESKL